MATGMIKTILIIKPSALGDIVLALPSLSALRKHFPDARIDWMIRPEFSKLLEGHPHINQLIYFDRNSLKGFWKNPNVFFSLIDLIKQLRKKRYDVVFDFQGLFRTAALSWLSGCKKRIGMANAREGASLFYNVRVKPDKDNLHLIDFYLKMLNVVGIENPKSKFVFSDDNQVQLSVDKILERSNITSGNYIVFVPGSAHEDKCWQKEKYIELAKKLYKKYSLPIVCVGSESEKKSIDTLTNDSKGIMINLAGQTTLKELIFILKKSALVISNDTGPGHIASGLGMPLVMMFSWSNPARIYPYGRKECIAAVEPFNRGIKIKSNDPRHNISNITVDEVFKKAVQQLG